MRFGDLINPIIMHFHLPVFIHCSLFSFNSRSSNESVPDVIDYDWSISSSKTLLVRCNIIFETVLIMTAESIH